MRHLFRFLTDNIQKDVRSFVLVFCGSGTIYHFIFLNVHGSDSYAAAIYVGKTIIGIISSVISAVWVNRIKERREKNNSKEKYIKNGKNKNDEKKRA